MQAEVFLDTAYAIALSSPPDQFHARAVELAEQLEALGTRLVTTRAVLLEIGNALSKPRYRQAAVQLLAALEADPKVDIVPLGDAVRLDEPARRFDVVLCASGLFFMPDMLAALREWWRVLKPGGQVGFSGWGSTYQQPLLGLWHARLHQYGVPLPTAAPIQRLAAPTTCQQVLHEAGFVEIVVQSEQLGYYLRTPEE
jgi:SAM-dependent methyltransferase